jgi:putative oxidoreductase
MVKKFFQVTEQKTWASLALLLLRVVAGVAFMYHGWGKIQMPMTWAGADSAIPGFFQLLAAVAEFAGGLGWILGLFTSLASFGLVVTMAVAVGMHAFVFGHPFVDPQGGMSYELAAVYLCVSFVLLFVGPGKFSADAKLFGKK